MISKQQLLTGDVCGTIAAIMGWLVVLMGKNDVLRILAALCFTLSAGISWKQYIKKQQEEEKHD